VRLALAVACIGDPPLQQFSLASMDVRASNTSRRTSGVHRHRLNSINRNRITMRILLAVALLAIGALVLPTAYQPAHAQQVITRITPEAMAQAMTQAGYQTKVLRTDKGEKYLELSIMGGTSYADLYECNQQGCMTVNVYGIGPKGKSAQVANSFNQRSLFCTGFIDSAGNFVISMSMTLAGGVTVKHLQEQMGRYVDELKLFVSLL
jgi:hypothetical protein